MAERSSSGSPLGRPRRCRTRDPSAPRACRGSPRPGRSTGSGRRRGGTAPTRPASKPAPTREGWMERVRQPALVVDRPLTEHRVELRFAFWSAGVGEGRGEAVSLDWTLGVALQLVRWADAEQVVQGGNHIDGVDVLVAHLTVPRDPRRPRDEAEIGSTTLVPGEPLPVRERAYRTPTPNRCCSGCTSSALRARRGGARFSSTVSGTLLKNLFSLNDPFGPPSALEPLSETTTTMVLSSWPDSSR